MFFSVARIVALFNLSFNVNVIEFLLLDFIFNFPNIFLYQVFNQVSELVIALLIFRLESHTETCFVFFYCFFQYFWHFGIHEEYWIWSFFAGNFDHNETFIDTPPQDKSENDKIFFIFFGLADCLPVNF